MFQVQILFAEKWHNIDNPLATRDDANWAIGKWKQANNAPGADRSFRVVEIG